MPHFADAPQSADLYFQAVCVIGEDVPLIREILDHCSGIAKRF